MLDLTQKEKDLLLEVLTIHRETLYESQKKVSHATAQTINKEIEEISLLHEKICSSIEE